LILPLAVLLPAVNRPSEVMVPMAGSAVQAKHSSSPVRSMVLQEAAADRLTFCPGERERVETFFPVASLVT